MLKFAVDLSYSGSGVREFEEEEDGFTVDFDVFGYMRDQDKYRRIRSTGVLNFSDEDVSCESKTPHHILKSVPGMMFVMYYIY